MKRDPPPSLIEPPWCLFSNIDIAHYPSCTVSSYQNTTHTSAPKHVEP